MITLQEILLFEGLLKIPQKLVDKIYNQAQALIAARLIGLVEEEISQTQQEIPKIIQGVRQFFKKKNDLLTQLGALKKQFKTPKSAASKQEYMIPYSIPFIDKDEKLCNVEKIKITYKYSYDSDEFVWSLFFLTTSEAVIFSAKEWSFETLINKPFSELAYKYQSILQQKKYQISDLEELKKKYTTISKQDRIGKDYLFFRKTSDKPAWGFNGTIKLTKDLFEDWNLSGNANLEKAITNKAGALKDLYVKYVFQDKADFAGEDVKGYAGYYRFHEELFSIMIFLPCDKDTIHYFDIVIEDVKRTIEHEVGHLIQDIIKYSTQKTSPRAGYPSKKIASGKTDRSPEGEWIRPHTLRDVEFYPRLRDAKGRIERQVKNVGVESRERIDLFRTLVGIRPKEFFRFQHYQIDPWLETLKKEAPLKWAKVVKELYKELSPIFKEKKNA